MQVERADGDDVVAVDDGAGVVDGDQPVGVAVEGQAERRPPRPRPRAASGSGWVAPQLIVDVATVGLVVDHDDVGAQAVEDLRRRPRSAAPLAQSSDDVEAVEAPAVSNSADEVLDVGARRRPAASRDGRRRRSPAAGPPTSPPSTALELGLDAPPRRRRAACARPARRA